MEKIRILYAEGYDLVLFTAKQLLEAEGWEVEVCRDGAAALKKLEGDERFDLLILDDRLGGVSGGELIARAGECAPAHHADYSIHGSTTSQWRLGFARSRRMLRQAGGLERFSPDLPPTAPARGGAAWPRP